MSSKDDSAFSKPGFACPNGNFDWGNEGLTKREYAAIQIMAGIMGDPSRNAHFQAYAADAVKAVKSADALFAELEKEPK